MKSFLAQAGGIEDELSGGFGQQNKFPMVPQLMALLQVGRPAGDDFIRLTLDQMGSIVDIQLERLRQLLAERKVAIDLDQKAKDWLAEKGYDPVYGARPLKRVIQRELQNPLAGLILEGRIAEGDQVSVSAGETGLVINGEAVSEERAA